MSRRAIALLLGIASCLPSFPEIECTRGSACFSGMCSGARCLPLGDALGVNAQSMLIVRGIDGVPEVDAFDLGAPIDFALADRAVVLFYPCALQAIGLQPGKVETTPASDTQPLPFPSAAFDRDETGAWSAREVYEAFEELRDVRIVSAFDPCPTWRADAFETLAEGTASPPFLITRPGGAVVFSIPGVGLYRSDASRTELVLTSTSIHDAIVLNDDSIALLSNDRCLTRLGEQTAIICDAPKDWGLAPRAAARGEIYLAYGFHLFVLTDVWRELEISSLIYEDPWAAPHLEPIAPTDMLAAFPAPASSRDRGELLRIRGSGIEVIPLPGDEEVIGFVPSSDPSAVFVATDAGRVYRFNGTTFSRFSTRTALASPRLSPFQGGVIVLQGNEIIAIPNPGRDCSVGSLPDPLHQAAALDDGSIVVLSYPDPWLLTRFRQIVPGATCGVAP
jgi:hypothetical protein